METLHQHWPRKAEWFRVYYRAVHAGIASAGLDEQRIAGGELSLERATDLALRVVDEELAAASAAAVPEGDGTAGSTNTPRRQGW
jgi:hypothetical protein